MLNAARIVGDRTHWHSILLRGQGINGALPACSDAWNDCFYMSFEPLCSTIYERDANFIIGLQGKLHESLIDEATRFNGV